MIITPKSWNIFEWYSSTTRLIRIIAMMLRFLHNMKNKNNRIIGFLSSTELQTAELRIIIIVQNQCFKNDITIILKSPAKYQGNLRHLSTFIDDQGLLRVGGRLQNAVVKNSAQHPYLLSNNIHLLIY